MGSERDDLLRNRDRYLRALAEEVWAGRCVAFVGAGFSIPAGVPGWRGMLESVLHRLPEDEPWKAAISSLLERRDTSSRDLEIAAQLLKDALGDDAFRDALRHAMSCGGSERYERRRDLLLQIPFRAVLTTNFDGLLAGDLPGPGSYRELLRQGWSGPWDPRYWPARSGEEVKTGPPVYQLHGDLGQDKVIFARRDYRDQVFGQPGYLTTLKSIFATHTVLFMGFSFSDAYLDFLRGELLHLVDERRDQDPPVLSYALMSNVSAAEALYQERHEGLRVLWYDSADEHAEFDELLKRLADETNPMRRLGRKLRESGVLWLDPHPENNDEALRQLGAGHEDPPFTPVRDIDDAVGQIRQDPERWDLVLTHWGYQEGGDAAAQRLLQRLHEEELRVPVIVFGDPEHRDENRRLALRWGAADFVWEWVDLFQAADRVLRATP